MTNVRKASQPAKRNSVCIFGGYVADAIAGTNMKGGAELQMALLAQSLACGGIPVTVVDPEVRVSSTPMENLSIKNIPRWNEGVRGLRFLTHRIPNLFRLLKSTGAGLYYSRGFSFQYLLPLAVARLTGARFALAVASDFDLLGFRERYRRLYARRLSLWGWISTVIPNEVGHVLLLRFADVLLVQHKHQEQMARKAGPEVLRLNNIVDNAILRAVPGAHGDNVIVVGTLSAYKNLRTLLPVIHRLVDVSFEFVGEATDEEGAAVRRELAQCPNVVLRGLLDRAGTIERIAKAKVLVNVSLHEGFPNTFLEAWALGTPVISLTVDPGGIIKEHGLGYVCDGNIDMLCDLLRRKTYDIDQRRVREYIVQHHSGEHAVRVIQNILVRNTNH